MSDLVECRVCKELKPHSEFYERGKDDPRRDFSICKHCKREQSKRQQVIDKKISTVPSENLVIARLSAEGIPVLPGKAFSHQRADIVAYGCILIEVKSSRLHDGKFQFHFSNVQRKHGIRGEIVVLVCRHDNADTFHIFPANSPMFYNPNGRLKHGLTYTPNRSNAGRPVIVTDHMMKQAEDNWNLVRNFLLLHEANLTGRQPELFISGIQPEKTRIIPNSYAGGQSASDSFFINLDRARKS